MPMTRAAINLLFTPRQLIICQRWARGVELSEVAAALHISYQQAAQTLRYAKKTLRCYDADELRRVLLHYMETAA